MKEKIVILGAGESGIGTAILAKKQGFEVFVSDQGAIADSTKDNFDQLEIDWEENTHTISKMEGANYVMKSPGIPSNVPFMDVLRDLQIPIISEIEFASKYTDATLIGITGSNGKTTTAMLTHHILKSAGFDVGLAGNIGTVSYTHLTLPTKA